MKQTNKQRAKTKTIPELKQEEAVFVENTLLFISIFTLVTLLLLV